MRGPFTAFVVCFLACNGCAKILEIDKDYVAEPAGHAGGAGGIGSGGSGNDTSHLNPNGGSTGDQPGSSGTSGAGAADAASSGGFAPSMPEASMGAPSPRDAMVTCPSGQKLCLGKCFPPDPSVGCGLTGCDACPNERPANAFTQCVDQACAFACLQGFQRNTEGTGCDPVQSNTGGATGTGGSESTGGGPLNFAAPCTPSSNCSSCGGIFPGCCDPFTRHCGCDYVAACI